MKLKNRLSLAVTAVSAAALFASFSTVYLLVRRDETRDLDLALTSQAQAFAHVVLAAGRQAPMELDGFAEVPESLRPTERYIAMYDEQGRLQSATKNLGADPPSLLSLGFSSANAADIAHGDVRARSIDLRGVLVPLGNKGRRLLFAASRSTVDADASFLLRTLLGIFLLATAATGLFSRLLGARLARDVRAIAGVARAVSSGNLKARVGAQAKGSAETQALAADLDHMIAQLSALVDTQRTFVSHAAHELRSPLSTLRGELQLALRRPRDVEGYQRTIAEVLVDVEALARLSEDLLTLARVQARGPDDARAMVGDIVAEAVRLSRGPAAARNVGLEEAAQNAEHAQLVVRGNRGDLVRALRNLVENAIAHGPEKEAVVIQVEPHSHHVDISVLDRGPGVSEEDEPHIFEPFYRGSKDRGDDRPGAGLGLAITREIVKGLDGDVRLDRSHREGAKFVLTLPRVKES